MYVQKERKKKREPIDAREFVCNGIRVYIHAGTHTHTYKDDLPSLSDGIDAPTTPYRNEFPPRPVLEMYIN